MPFKSLSLIDQSWGLSDQDSSEPLRSRLLTDKNTEIIWTSTISWRSLLGSVPLLSLWIRSLNKKSKHQSSFDKGRVHFYSLRAKKEISLHAKEKQTTFFEVFPHSDWATERSLPPSRGWSNPQAFWSTVMQVLRQARRDRDHGHDALQVEYKERNRFVQSIEQRMLFFFY